MAKKILVVDDDKDLTTNFEKVLRAQGYEVAVAHTANEGLKTALSVKPDLIILDVILETDTAGFEFVYQVRSKREESRYKAIKDVPIILITGINQVTKSRFSLNDKDSFLPEIKDMFTKPVKAEMLLAKIKQIL